MDDPVPHHHFSPTSLSFLTKGSQVEVSSNDDGFNGAWYIATVIHPPPSIYSPNHDSSKNLVYVEYHHILSDDGSSSRLREYANMSFVRPSPVPDTIPPNFQLNDLVDAFYRDGWLTGVITTVVDASNFVVTFRNPPEEIQFRSSDLRIHKKWAGGRWFQPQKQVTAGWMFTVGKKVEVSFEKESLCDVWFPATVLKNLGNSTFLVEYQQPGADDETILHKVTVDFHHIRPSPPHLRDKNFVLLEKVDAYYDFGWWTGVITKELADNRYKVFFKHTKKEKEFIYSRVRPHMEWKGGKWYNTSQGDAVVRKAHSLIDNQIAQATPIISKQSPVTTSPMKRRRQTNLDSNDKNSSKDEIMNADLSKITKNPSIGRSEGFASKGDAVLRKALSLIEYQTEQAIPIIIKQSPVTTSPMKRRRQTNLDSSDKNSSKDEVRNDDSSKKTKNPSVGRSEGFDSEGDVDVRKAHSLIDNQIEQASPIISKKYSVTTSPMKRRRQTNLDSNDKNSSKDEIMKDDLSKITKNPSVGRPEGFDSEVNGMTDQAFCKTENISHGKEVHSKRGKNIKLTTPTTDSSRKRGKLTNELKRLQTLTKGSEVDPVETRTQEIGAEKDATKDSLFSVLDLQCKEMTVSQGKLVKKLPSEDTPIVAKSDTKQPGLPLAPLTVVDQGSEGYAPSVTPKRKRGRPPKLQALSPETPVTVNYEIESVVPSTLSVVEAGQRKEAGLTTSSGTKSLEDVQGPVIEQPGLAGKQNVPSIKDKLPNENTGQDVNVHRGQGAKKYSAKKRKRAKRRTISINTGSVAQDSQDASKEKADGSLEKDSPRRNPEASVGKSWDMESDDQPLSRWFERKHSPITNDGPEGSVEQSSKANEGHVEAVHCNMDFGNLPFVRITSLWKAIVSMEAFRMLPQKPHFRPLIEGVRAGAQEGLAIGSMVTFSTVVDKTCSLRFDDPRSTIDDYLETLVELENNGFDVEVIRERLTGLLLIKDKQEELEEQSKGIVEKIKENDIQGKKIEDEVKEIARQMRELEERRKQVELKKEKRNSEIGAMEAVIKGIQDEIRGVGAEFDGLAAAPFETTYD
ncbi:hypothetical protein L1987_28986 [Smallanthus sonchifolius]|uniref:Uncharacterized protein n=1 Tax=Smallanthus sonchifolius TaxID=185202 RepID=A0ACB9HYL6_9ASTR|nr:hypothetical protein L1987_28986 [Smallanthus sonchifolius]